MKFNISLALSHTHTPPHTHTFHSSSSSTPPPAIRLHAPDPHSLRTNNISNFSHPDTSHHQQVSFFFFSTKITSIHAALFRQFWHGTVNVLVTQNMFHLNATCTDVITVFFVFCCWLQKLGIQLKIYGILNIFVNCQNSANKIVNVYYLFSFPIHVSYVNNLCVVC